MGFKESGFVSANDRERWEGRGIMRMHRPAAIRWLHHSHTRDETDRMSRNGLQRDVKRKLRFTLPSRTLYTHAHVKVERSITEIIAHDDEFIHMRRVGSGGKAEGTSTRFVPFFSHVKLKYCIRK